MVSGCPVQVVGLSVRGWTGMVGRVGVEMQLVLARRLASGGMAGRAFGEAFGIVACFGGEPPEGQLGSVAAE